MTKVLKYLPRFHVLCHLLYGDDGIVVWQHGKMFMTWAEATDTAHALEKSFPQGEWKLMCKVVETENHRG